MNRARTILVRVLRIRVQRPFVARWVEKPTLFVLEKIKFSLILRLFNHWKKSLGQNMTMRIGYFAAITYDRNKHLFHYKIFDLWLYVLQS